MFVTFIINSNSRHGEPSELYIQVQNLQWGLVWQQPLVGRLGRRRIVPAAAHGATPLSAAASKSQPGISVKHFISGFTVHIFIHKSNMMILPRVGPAAHGSRAQRRSPATAGLHHPHYGHPGSVLLPQQPHPHS